MNAFSPDPVLQRPQSTVTSNLIIIAVLPQKFTPWLIYFLKEEQGFTLYTGLHQGTSASQREDVPHVEHFAHVNVEEL